MADPGKMSAHDFAAYIKKQMPELANYPDDELVKGILSRRPDLRSRIIEEPPAPKMPLADSAWGRMKQAYEGTLPLLDENMATLQGVGNIARGTVNAVKGAASMLKLPTKEELSEAVQTAPAAFPIALLARRMGQPLPDAASGLKLIPPALRDIKSGPDYYLKAAGPESGNWAGQAITALATAGAERGIAKLNEPFTPEQAAQRITDAVNPVAKSIPGYQESLGRHLNKIMEFADRRGLKINSLDSLTKAMQGSGLELKNYWYDKILGPAKGKKVQISGIPGYAGKADGAVATLGDLDARLSQINAELNPKFAKEGVAAQAAVKSAADLNAEAAGIRQVLYPELSKATGISAGELSDTRQAFGSLRDLGDKTQLAASKVRAATNAAKNAPKTFNPFSKTKEFVADQALRAIQGDVPGKTIAKTLGKTQSPKYTPPSPSFAEAPQAARFPRYAQTGSPTEIGVTGSTPEEIAAQAQKLSARQQVNRLAEMSKEAQTPRKPMWQMGEEELEMIRRRPTGTPAEPTVMQRAERVMNLKSQIERARASGTDPYGLVSQLRQAEEDLAASTRESWGKQYSDAPLQPGHSKSPTGGNYTAEQLAEMKKKLGLQ